MGHATSIPLLKLVEFHPIHLPFLSILAHVPLSAPLSAYKSPLLMPLIFFSYLGDFGFGIYLVRHCDICSLDYK